MVSLWLLRWFCSRPELRVKNYKKAPEGKFIDHHESRDWYNLHSIYVAKEALPSLASEFAECRAAVFVFFRGIPCAPSFRAFLPI